MGMFDWYRPASQLECPACNTLLTEWQGKDAACSLFVWKQGEAAPIEQLVSEESRLALAQRMKQRLPQEFEIYSYDCPNHKPVVAACTCSNGVWSTTELKQHVA